MFTWGKNLSAHRCHGAREVDFYEITWYPCVRLLDLFLKQFKNIMLDQVGLFRLGINFSKQRTLDHVILRLLSCSITVIPLKTVSLG